MRALLSLRKYLVRYRSTLLVGLLFIALSNVFAAIIPSVVRETLNVLLEPTLIESKWYSAYLPEYFTGPARLATLGALLIFLFSSLKGLSMYMYRIKLIVMSRYIEYDQKNEIFKHYQKMGLAFYSRNYTGDLMNRISDDVSKVRMFTGPAVMYSMNLSIMIVAVVSMMLYVNPTITMYVLIPLPILATIIYFVSDTMNRKSDLIQKKLSNLTSYVQETFAGLKVVKSAAAEPDFIDEFESMNQSYKEDNMALVKINGIFMPSVIGLIGLSILITLYVGGNAVVVGEFSLGNIVEYVIYVNMLTWPVASLGYVTSLVQRGAASQHRINEFMNEEPVLNDGDLRIDKLTQSIEFKNVWYKYPETDVWVLEDVSFTINAKNKFGIIGTTGSGKSTMAKLLLGLYEPTKGEILIDGHPLLAYDKNDLRKLFGYVSQDIFLFSETLRDNILFGCDSQEDDANLNDAIQSAALEEEIDNLPKGLETMLGERGITLSGGQKQRTAIARALIKKPNILLIDDGLSAVDTKTELAIKNSLNTWNKSQTFINISHRISSVQDSECIIFMHEGKVLEKGSHLEMLAYEGMYKDLFDKQMMVEENS